jgi:hypothetical protein
MKYIKAGISKAGKPYKAFWSCPECKTTQNAKQGFSNQFSKSNREGEQIKKVIDYKNYKNGAIKQAQDRKEGGIAISGAKRIAGEIVAAMIHSGELKGSDWFIQYREIANKIYNFSPLENGRPTNSDEDFILPEDINSCDYSSVSL